MIACLCAAAGTPLHLVGHSYGGAVAAAYAQNNPDYIRSLTLIEPVLFQLLRRDRPSAEWDEIATLAETHIAHVEAGRLDAAADLFMGYWVGAENWNGMPDRMRVAVTAAMPKVAREWRQMWSDERALAREWPQTGPVLLIEGSATTRAVKAVTRCLNRDLPHAERQYIQGAGHLAPITHAAAVNNSIRDFIARVDAQGCSAAR